MLIGIAIALTAQPITLNVNLPPSFLLDENGFAILGEDGFPIKLETST